MTAPAARVTPLAQFGDHGDPLLGVQVAVDAEAVRAEDRPLRQQCLEVVEVVGVPGVAHDDLGQVEALLLGDPLLFEPALHPGGGGSRPGIGAGPAP